MDQQELDKVDLERGEAVIHRSRKVKSAQIFVADLGGEEDVLALDARGAHRLADRSLGAVFAGGVYVAVTGPERRENGIGRQAAGQRRRAEAEERDGAGFGTKRQARGHVHELTNLNESGADNYLRIFIV